MAPVLIDGSSLTFEAFDKVVRGGATVEISPEALDKVRESRAVVESALEGNEAVYGVNTGVGKLADVRIDEDRLEELQANLIRSTAAGVGEPLPDDVVRGVMLLKLNALASGYSGCTSALLDLLADFLNNGLIPVIPSKGSVGASGDLAPLSHMGLALVGEGEIRHDNVIMQAGTALSLHGLKAVTLAPKEGLSIVNGTQVMTALGCVALLRSRDLFLAADIAAAMSTEAMLATDRAFDGRIHEVRGMSGQQQVASNLRALLSGSEIVESHKSCGKIQDVYSIRCSPQVHGACRDAADYVHSVLAIEMNAATDNPLVFADSGAILSGGNFHGEPVALALDFLGIAMSELASISERRIAVFMDESLSELPPFLARDSGLHSGFMMAQVTAASLISENKILAHPASVDSIPTSANKEDHVSMGLNAGLKLQTIVDNAETVLAIELLCGAQGLDFREGLTPAKGTGYARELIREKVSFREEDRVWEHDIAAVKELVRTGKLPQAVASRVGLS